MSFSIKDLPAGLVEAAEKLIKENQVSTDPNYIHIVTRALKFFGVESPDMLSPEKREEFDRYVKVTWRNGDNQVQRPPVQADYGYDQTLTSVEPRWNPDDIGDDTMYNEFEMEEISRSGKLIKEPEENSEEE